MSASDELVMSDLPEHPANLIPSLCADFFRLGWCTGTGGSMSICQGDHAYIAPSGVMKERMKPQDLYVISRATKEVIRKPSRPLKQSDCTPLFFNCYNLRGANACIHTHSQNAVMATLLWPGETFEISHQEMIKGVRIGGSGKALAYHDTLVIPILDNVPVESELEVPMAEVLQRYPDARHGLFVWSDTWERCKGMVECIDYLLGAKFRRPRSGPL